MNINFQGLSVVVIARNAERTIARCLQSVATIANEIIVVINDCSDDTRSIAETYNARVVEHKWSGFRDQKNFATSLAKYEWILSLDADEAISDGLKTSINGFIHQEFQPYEAAKFPRKTFFLGKWIAYGDWYPDYNLRLFKKGRGSFVGGSVHEKLHVEGKVKCLSGDILHYPCDSLEEFTKRNISYAELAAHDLYKRYANRTARFWFASIVHGILQAYWKFFRNYIIKLGFLDGATGYYLAKSQSFLTFYKFFRLRDLVLHKE